MIIIVVLVCYGLAPFTGALVRRYKWHKFRKRFDELRLYPVLNFQSYWRQDADTENDDVFRITGEFESVTDGQTLWIRNNELTIPISLENAESYLLPDQKNGEGAEGDEPGEDPPEKLRWGKISSITEGARVFAGGTLKNINGRRSFISTKENPLIVLFYNGSDRSVPTRVMRSCRRWNEYWNFLTPYSLVIGALCLIVMAVLYQARPAFRLTVIVSFMAMFIPLYPFIPPGLLFTVIFRRLGWRAGILRAYRDLARLPLRYLTGPENLLPGGEKYGFIRCSELPPEARDGGIPLLLSEFAKTPAGGQYYFFGTMNDGTTPGIPDDPFTTFGILPGEPAILARRCAVNAYIMEAAAWIFLLAGIALNIFFVGIILSLFGVLF